MTRTRQPKPTTVNLGFEPPKEPELKGIPRITDPPRHMPEGGTRIYGWANIARASGVPLNQLKRAAHRRRDPAPIYSFLGKIVAEQGQLVRWVLNQTLSTEDTFTLGGPCSRTEFSGKRSLVGPGVYGLCAQGAERIKIGWTDQISRRIAQLETGCPFPLQLLFWIRGPRELEGNLHARLREHRVHMEWFADVDPVRSALTDAAKLHGGAWVVSK